MIVVKESAPHIRRKSSVTRMMADVLIALGPTLIFAAIVYPLQTLVNLFISLFIMIVSEFVYVGLRNMMPKDDLKHSFKEKFIYAYKGKYGINNILTPAISAVIFTLVMPAGAPIYAIIVGAFVGIVIGKLVFGGLGSNIFNPAAVGMLFAKLCFGNQYVTYVDTWYYKMPVTVGGTPLTFTNGCVTNYFYQYKMLDIFLGKIPGTLGEVYVITILIGLVYLLIRKSIDYRIVVSYFSTVVLISLSAGLAGLTINSSFKFYSYVLYQLLTGGVLFGGVFMLTDPVTSPINSPSRVMFGIIAGVVTMFIRIFAALPEGVGFSILIANMVAVVLDHYEWSGSRYTWKKILAIALLIILPITITFLAVKYGGIFLWIEIRY